MLNEKLQEYAILEYIFGSNIHLEIVQWCTDILTFMIHARTLTTHELDIIWSPIDGNLLHYTGKFFFLFLFYF